MNIDRTKLMEDIEAMKEKLASMEAELNKPEKFKHFPSEGDEYYFYTFVGTVCRNIASNDKLKISVYKTEKETQNAYNRAVAVEKVKRRIIELQGDWKPNWMGDNKGKFYIQYNHNRRSFRPVCLFATQQDTSFPYMENEETALTIINEFHEELKLIFEIK